MLRRPGRKVKKTSNTISISHDYARQQEVDAAETYGGKVTKGSGCGNAMVKGDVRVKGKYRIECKCTINNSYALKYDYLENFIEQSISLGETPLMQVHFIDEMGIKKRGYIIIPEEFIQDKLKE